MTQYGQPTSPGFDKPRTEEEKEQESKKKNGLNYMHKALWMQRRHL